MPDHKIGTMPFESDSVINERHSYLWAKTGAQESGSYHPLILHLLDVAACAEAVLTREPATTRERMGAVIGMDWQLARPWILLIIACHDLGKACPGFQAKWDKAHQLLDKAELHIPPGVDTHINHAFVSQIALFELLAMEGWPEDSARLVSDAIGCHHGERASPLKLDSLEGDRKILGDKDWTVVRRSLFELLLNVFNPGAVPAKSTLSGPDFMLLAGLTSFSDWIGSNEEWFSFGKPEQCADLHFWYDERYQRAGIALDAIGWELRRPLQSDAKSFEQVFQKFTPRPMQLAVAKAISKIDKPCILLVEAPMGEGKTEAAFYAYLEFQRRLGHRGLYIALPTKATGNAMFERTLEFLAGFSSDRKLDLQLVHGATLLNDSFQNLRLGKIYNTNEDGSIRAGEWFTSKKRALLSEYGVGTVDQALLPILPVRHNFVRLWGLANRVIVFDEIHAYDVYTSTLLIHLLQWLLALDSSIILLSATLPPSFRRKLAELVQTEMPEAEVKYPRISIFQTKTMEQISYNTDPIRRRKINLSGISPDIVSMCTTLTDTLTNGGMALALINTVQRAQELYMQFPQGEEIAYKGQPVGKKLPNGTEIYLFHARFPADKRQLRENRVLTLFGKNSLREGRKILIATQVAEQSLDLDFDVLLSDLAPIDLLLQRAGRLWRHERSGEERHYIPGPRLIVAGLTDDEPPDFGQPLWWGSVYREDILLRTWVLLSNRQEVTLPDEIDEMVQKVYEENVDIPSSLQERMDKALVISDGEASAHKGLADQAIIGFPDDASWDNPATFVKYDEDEPGLHPTLVAQTRLDEPSVTAIPLWPLDAFDLNKEPDFTVSKGLYLRGISISRFGVVKKLQTLGVPEGWKMSSLLRTCLPLILDDQGRWCEDISVRLDNELGLVYEQKGAE